MNSYNYDQKLDLDLKFSDYCINCYIQLKNSVVYQKCVYLFSIILKINTCSYGKQH
jgi:hypothetical protein